MRAFRRLAAVSAALAALVLPGTAYAGSGGQLRVEPAWYAGHEVSFLQPTLYSADSNGGVFGCFGLGPNLADVARATAPLYVVLDPAATQDHCDGDPTAARHDHVLSAAPGDPGYTGAWSLVFLVEATPGSVDLASHPFTSTAQVQAAITSGVLVDVTSALAPAGVSMVAPVIGGK